MSSYMFCNLCYLNFQLSEEKRHRMFNAYILPHFIATLLLTERVAGQTSIIQASLNTDIILQTNKEYCFIQLNGRLKELFKLTFLTVRRHLVLSIC